jgi:hypothetical protein
MEPSLDEAVISDGESEGEPGGRSAINLRWVGIKCVGKPCKTGQTLCRSDELTQPVLEHHIAAVLLLRRVESGQGRVILCVLMVSKAPSQSSATPSRLNT